MECWFRIYQAGFGIIFYLYRSNENKMKNGGALGLILT